MFRPKEPFEGQETIDARLIETNNEGKLRNRSTNRFDRFD
jgi:hypothetical protein